MCLLAGALLLYTYSLAPPIFIGGGVIVAFVLFVLGYYVYRANRWATNISTVLGFVSIVSSTLIPQHLSALSMIGSNPRITVLDALQLLGFYLFPAAYIVLRFMLRRSL